ncbi:unnamed protein product [Alternaria burnsii]|nr:unnamed protein product [Alternaria burnsii]
MPYCTPCSTFADFAELPPTPQPARKWSSLSDLIASAGSGCDLCTLCWQYAHNFNFKDDNGPIWLCWGKDSNNDDGAERLELRLTKSVIIVDVQDRSQTIVADDDVIVQARRLLENCLSSHEKCGEIAILDPKGSGENDRDSADRCPELKSLPRRLLDLSQGSDILVINVESWIVDGISSVAELSQYCTLSYRWGVATQSCILRAPFSSQIIIGMADMPQTFKDAIEITRRFGIRFLWIDALCIVQPEDCGDNTDWNAEGHRMGSIYHNAIFTIAATCADSVTDGFLSKVDSERIRAVSCKVTQRAGNGEAQSSLAKICGMDYDHVIDDSALNNRGWVTQERFLSRRVLHFTAQGIIWECSKTKEHGSNAVSRMIVLDVEAPYFFDSVFRKKLNGKAWMKIVSRYSHASFTNAEDRLIALSSLARFFHSRLGHNNAYCAGMWCNSLKQDLLWHRRYPPDSKTDQRSNLAPTWSWASVTGAIGYLEESNRGNPYTQPVVPPARVLSVRSVLTPHDNLYGNVLEGRLELVAQVLNVMIWTRSAKSRQLKEDVQNKRVSISRSVYWDELQEDSTEEEQYEIIPFRYFQRFKHILSHTSHPAIIVRKLPWTTATATEHDPIRTYRRIGLLEDVHSESVVMQGDSEKARYNYGQAVQEVATLFLV